MVKQNDDCKQCILITDMHSVVKHITIVVSLLNWDPLISAWCKMWTARKRAAQKVKEEKEKAKREKCSTSSNFSLWSS